jgi:DNA polymerase-3 subunit delta'
MQQSGFSPTKFVLIENIQRMSPSAMNAFLKTSEEPLPHRFIIATLPHISQVLDTILSRSIAIHFDPLSEEEMQDFASTSHIAPTDKELREILIAMAMGKP